MFKGKQIELTSRDGCRIGAYDVPPQGVHKGGLILIQEVFGVNDDMRRACDRFAAQGYHVIAPSMFDRLEKGFETMDHSPAGIQKALPLARRNRLEDAISDIGACFDLLRAEGDVFLTGFCYGGSMSWMGACHVDGLAAASAYYGSMLPQTADLTAKCPVIAHFGKLDAHIPIPGCEAFAKANPDVQVYYYDAGHGFAREGSSDYHAESDALAFQRTLDLFAANGTD